MTYRVGRHLGRTIYRIGIDGYEELIGIMDTAEDGALVVESLNARERVIAGRGTSDGVPPCPGSGSMARPYPCGRDQDHLAHDVGLAPGRFL